MRKSVVLSGMLLTATVWGGSVGIPSAGARSPRAPDRTTAKTVAPTTLPIATLPPGSTPPLDPGYAPTGSILMVKLYVGDLPAAEKFYGAVFGAKLALTIGDNAHVVSFPNGGPGLILLKKGPDEKKKQGSFIVQVPNMDAAQALAVANGAKEQGKFAGQPGSQVARSIDVLDPWGNQVEILQIG